MSVVLVVEDDVLLRAQIARGLHRLPGVDVLEAGTVRESIELADGVPLDLVVSDLQLPDGSALQLLPHLVQHGARVPTILMSGCIDRFAKQLPVGIRVFEKPLHMAELREAVSAVLGCDNARSPFSLPDYLQLAGLGRHSVQIEVSQSAEPFGTIVIYDGQPWTASDALGAGIDAFLRMMVASDLTFACSPPPSLREERTLSGTCESLLLDSTRLIDERRAGRDAVPEPIPAPPQPPRTDTQRYLATTRRPATPASVPAITIPPVRMPSVSIPPVPRRTPTSSVPAVPLAEGTTPRTSLDGEFRRLYDNGIEALLAKRYTEALSLFLEAQKIRSTPTLEANLNRLRSLGVV